jgi:hypothetical protein
MTEKTEAEKIIEGQRDVVVLKEDLIKEYSAELVEFLIGQTRRYKDFGMSQATLKQLIELKKAYWPATNKNLQLTATTDFNNLLDKWMEARSTIKVIDKKEIENEVKLIENGNE